MSTMVRDSAINARIDFDASSSLGFPGIPPPATTVTRSTPLNWRTDARVS